MSDVTLGAEDRRLRVRQRVRRFLVNRRGGFSLAVLREGEVRPGATMERLGRGGSG